MRNLLTLSTSPSLKKCLNPDLGSARASASGLRRGLAVLASLLLVAAVLFPGIRASAQVMDDAQPRTEVHLYRNTRIEEGEKNSVVLGFSVTAEVKEETATSPPTVSIPVRVWLVEGTAKEGVDFEAATHSLEFAPTEYVEGHFSRYIARKEVKLIELIDDDEEEGDETFGVTMELTAPRSFVSLHPGYPAASTITIVDNDGDDNQIFPTPPQPLIPNPATSSQSEDNNNNMEPPCPVLPSTTAGDVNDRETLVQFVKASLHGIRAELEDSEQDSFEGRCYREEGHWKDDSVYLFVISDDGTVVFDGAHAELEGEEIVAEVWNKIVEATQGDGFAEYYWDDPSTEEDNNPNPQWIEDGESPGTSRKVSYVVEFSASEGVFIIGSGIYEEEPEQKSDEPRQGGDGGCAVAQSQESTESVALGLLITAALFWAVFRKRSRRAS